MISFNLSNTVCASLATSPHLWVDQKSQAAGAVWSLAAGSALAEPSCCPQAALTAGVKPSKAASALSVTAQARCTNKFQPGWGCGS